MLFLASRFEFCADLGSWDGIAFVFVGKGGFWVWIACSSIGSGAVVVLSCLLIS